MKQIIKNIVGISKEIVFAIDNIKCRRKPVKL